MSGPLLIIETPRAGDYGHRFVTSSASLSESEIARIADEANRNPLGQTYISVARQTRQVLRNGTVRQGTERIILEGIDAAQLAQSQLDGLNHALAGLFPLVENLAQTIDWKSGEMNAVIVRPELRQWVARPEFQGLPLAKTSPISGPDDPRAAPPNERRSLRRASVLRSAVLLASIAIFAVVAGALFSRHSRRSPSTDAEQPAPELPVTAAFDDLSRKWGCPPDELAIALLRAANWERRIEADNAKLDKILAEPEVQSLIETAVQAEAPDQFLLDPAVQRCDDIRRLLEHRRPCTPQNALALRRWLFQAWNNFSQLKNAASEASPHLQNTSYDDGFVELLLKIPHVQLDIGTGDGFREPAAPIFDRQDDMICRVLVMIGRELNASGALETLMDEPAPSTDRATLLGMLQTLHRARNGLRKALSESRKSVVDQLPIDAIEAVRDKAYPSLEQFLDHLSQFDSL